MVMTDACSVVGNRDVEPFVPTLISCMARPAETADCIHKLGAITFVQVEQPLTTQCAQLLRIQFGFPTVLVEDRILRSGSTAWLLYLPSVLVIAKDRPHFAASAASDPTPALLNPKP